MSRRVEVLFGDALLHHHVSLIFGNGVFALRGVVMRVNGDYLEVREEKDEVMVHVPLASILYARVGVKKDPADEG